MPGRRGPKVLGDKTVMVGVKMPEKVSEAIQRAASVGYESPAGYVRRIVIERLRVDGFLPAIPKEQLA